MNKVCPSFCPSFCFLGIGSLVFFTGTQHGMRAPCGAVHDRAGFFENNVFGSAGFFECIGKFSYFFQFGL